MTTLKEIRPGSCDKFTSTRWQEHLLGPTATTMKSLSILLSLISLVVATPLSYSSQEQLSINADGVTYPGFDLDLTALRLVEMEGQAPVWVTELEKVCYIFCPISSR